VLKNKRLNTKKTAFKTCLYLLSSLMAFAVTGSHNAAAMPDPAARVVAPEFDTALAWLNVDRPLSMQELRGKVVILDFWTYGCINCIHIIPDLEKLEHKYGNKLAIIGVHSPKFDNEKNLATLRNIVIRYNLKHPVINDVELTLWDRYGVRAWPTLVIIDPEGYVAGGVSGEGHYDLLDRAVGNLIATHESLINTRPLPLALEADKRAPSLLAAPGKIAISDKLIAISDTSNHRIIITGHDGNTIKIYGGKNAGFNDGDAETARFRSPQGLAFSEDGLYVADTGNHSIRYIDLKSTLVRTVAGTGQQGGFNTPVTAELLESSLRSPWDLAYADKMLYIAMAGSHQIWRLNTITNTLRVFAGSGQEGIIDGRLRDAAFGQPSGLSIIDHWLYIADAEGSAVRRINLDKRYVETLIGVGLFAFGDKDGDFNAARLQHALGIAALDSTHILITDTYNHKLKLLDLNSRTIQTLAGVDRVDNNNHPENNALLNEPGGLAVYQNKILIADTNNHRIVQFHLDNTQLREWTIKFPAITRMSSLQ